MPGATLADLAERRLARCCAVAGIDSRIQHPELLALARLYANHKFVAQGGEKRAQYLRRICFLSDLDKIAKIRGAPTLSDWVAVCGSLRMQLLYSLWADLATLACNTLRPPQGVQFAVHRARWEARLRARCEGKWYWRHIEAHLERERQRQERLRAAGWTNSEEKLGDEATQRNVMRAVRLCFHLDQRGLTSFAQLDQRTMDELTHTKRVSTRDIKQSFLRHALRMDGAVRQIVIRKPQRSGLAATEIMRPDALRKRCEALLSSGLSNRYKLAGAFIVMYGQTASAAASLPLARIEVTQPGVRVRFSEIWLNLPDEISNLTIAYLRERDVQLSASGEMESPYLFPGQLPGTHLHGSTLRCGLNFGERGLLRLRASSILAAYLHGMRAASDLKRCLGVSIPTARHYATVLGPSFVLGGTTEGQVAFKEMVSVPA